jgi:hypothetical protein
VYTHRARRRAAEKEAKHEKTVEKNSAHGKYG